MVGAAILVMRLRGSTKGTMAIGHNILVQRAGELPQEVRSVLEQLLGRPIAIDEEVSIAAVPAQQIPSSSDRAAIAQELEAFLNRRATKVGDTPDEELEAAIEEAFEHVRHSRG